MAGIGSILDTQASRAVRHTPSSPSWEVVPIPVTVEGSCDFDCKWKSRAEKGRRSIASSDVKQRNRKSGKMVSFSLQTSKEGFLL